MTGRRRCDYRAHVWLRAPAKDKQHRGWRCRHCDVTMQISTYMAP